MPKEGWNWIWLIQNFRKMETKYIIQHTAKDEVILPLAAIHNNIYFLMDKKEKYVQTSDNFTCKVLSSEMVHICALENDINRIYGINAWAFIKKWFKAMPYFDSMFFCKMKLEKVNNDKDGFNIQ